MFVRASVSIWPISSVMLLTFRCTVLILQCAFYDLGLVFKFVLLFSAHKKIPCSLAHPPKHAYGVPVLCLRDGILRASISLMRRTYSSLFDNIRVSLREVFILSAVFYLTTDRSRVTLVFFTRFVIRSLKMPFPNPFVKSV